MSQTTLNIPYGTVFIKVHEVANIPRMRELMFGLIKGIMVLSKNIDDFLKKCDFLNEVDQKIKHNQ